MGRASKYGTFSCIFVYKSILKLFLKFSFWQSDVTRLIKVKSWKKPLINSEMGSILYLRYKIRYEILWDKIVYQLLIYTPLEQSIMEKAKSWSKADKVMYGTLVRKVDLTFKKWTMTFELIFRFMALFYT